MHVSGFMVPADKVATCLAGDCLKTALDAMVAKNVGCILVMDPTGFVKGPMGIVTKSDFIQAYQGGKSPTETTVDDIMTKDLLTIKENVSRDDAAKFLEKHKRHHAIVTDRDGKFAGLISSWDITVECARDGRAWPWNRSSDGKYHKPTETEAAPESPRSTADQNRRPRNSSFLEYIDSVRDLQKTMDD